MLSGHDYALGASSLTSSVGMQLRRIPLDDAWPAAPVDREQEQRVLDDWLPQRRDPLQRAQSLIDVIDSQLALIDDEGDIALVNRAWRLAAAMQETSTHNGVIGRNYLRLCHASAAQGCRDAAQVAEGIDAVLANRWRSFHYHYEASSVEERRLYRLRVWRFEEAGPNYVAVMHELLESHPISEAERALDGRCRSTFES